MQRNTIARRTRPWPQIFYVSALMYMFFTSFSTYWTYKKYFDLFVPATCQINQTAVIDNPCEEPMKSTSKPLEDENRTSMCPNMSSSTAYSKGRFLYTNVSLIRMGTMNVSKTNTTQADCYYHQLTPNLILWQKPDGKDSMSLILLSLFGIYICGVDILDKIFLSQT